LLDLAGVEHFHRKAPMTKSTTKTRRVTKFDADLERAHENLEALSNWAGALDDLSWAPWDSSSLAVVAKLLALRAQMALMDFERLMVNQSGRQRKPRNSA
jgi:hypothetical protein